jgi:hypothetical protein
MVHGQVKYLQFYREEPYLYGDDLMINFNNGLSYVWDKLKKHGDFVWRDVNDESPPTIVEGTIYASVWYSKSLRLLYNWAKKYPKLEIYICGPIVLHYDFSLGKELSNFHYLRADAEDFFFKGKTGRWNLEIPYTDKPIGYSVGLTKGYGCYWGHCRYCKITGKLEYRNINEIPVLDIPNHKYIWIHTYSLPPYMIKRFYPTLENRTDVNYATYVRGDKHVTQALKETLPKLSIDPKYLGFDVGVEFPSDNVLKYMKKGLTVQEYIDFTKVAASAGIRLHFNLIVGWKYTNWDDVKSVETFLNSISKVSKPKTITANIYPLTIVSNRSMFEDYQLDELEQFKTDYENVILGMPKFDEEQIKVNKRIIELYNSFPFMKLHDLTDPNSTWKVNSYGKQ